MDARCCTSALFATPAAPQALERTTGELIPGQALLLKCRKEITREEAIKLWAQKRKAGWQVCPPQWTPLSALQPR
jgi:hypothetical protein